MQKLTKQDVNTLESFELTAPYSEGLSPRQRKQKLRPEDIPIKEWRKRLGYAPEEVVCQTLVNTMQYYLTVECEECDNPRWHFKSRIPALRVKQQNESIASDTYFPSIKSGCGNTCSQFFVGDVSDRWHTYPLRSESQNGIALQDYTRYVGNPTSLKTDNAQSELGSIWKDHCWQNCVPITLSLAKSSRKKYSRSEQHGPTKLGQM